METPCIIPYAPRPLQWRFHQQRTRFCVLLCHRRFGKTVAAVNDLLRAALRTSRTDWRAAYAAPYLGQAKAVAWDYLRHFAGVIPGTRFHEGELRCDLPNGARIRLYGTDNARPCAACIWTIWCWTSPPPVWTRRAGTTSSRK